MNAQKQRFNMIEVVIALAIIVMVVVSVLALLPKAMMSNQEAINRMAAADMGEQFLNFFASRLEEDWDELEAIPAEKYGDGEADLLFSTYSMIPNSLLCIYHEAPNESARWDPAVSNKGVFRVQSRSASNQVDFDGYMRVWRTTTEMVPGDDSPKHVALHSEMSWPASLPYERRRKKVMNVQVFRPGSIKKEVSAMNAVPCNAAWCIENGVLSYYVLSDEATQFAVKEGALAGNVQWSVQALTCAPQGTIFFVNKGATGEELYRIPRGNIDGKENTEVYPVKVGALGTGQEKMTGLFFHDRKLYCVSESSKKIYNLDYLTGTASLAVEMNVAANGFSCGGVTKAFDGSVYVARNVGGGSELWTFETFPNGELTLVTEITGASTVTSIAAHPNGYVYAYDGNACYRIEPQSENVQTYVNFSGSIGDMAFYYGKEFQKCNVERACETTGNLNGIVYVNPSNNDIFSFEMTCADGTVKTRDDLMHDPGYVYDGMVTYIRFKAKGKGKQSVTFDGEPFTMKNKLFYTFTSDVGFPIKLHNGKYNPNKPGHQNAMGQWILEFSDVQLTIDYCDQGGGTGTTGSITEPPFTVIGGQLVLNEKSQVELAVLGANWRDTSHYVTVEFNVDGKSHQPFGSASDPIAGNVNYKGGSSFDAGIIETDGQISVTGRSFTPPPRRNKKPSLFMTAGSAPSNQQVMILLDGHTVPNIDGYGSQPDLAQFIAGYVNAETGKVELEPNQALFLFELGTTNVSSGDFQDLVVLVTVTPVE